jgi:hypothetical protein
MEQQMLDLLNRDRAAPANAAETKGQALPLRWNEELAAVARAHSLDMLNQGYFAHEDGQGRNVANRIEGAGLHWRSVGENIAIYNTVATAEAAFMNEPRFTKNHRANILNPGFSEVGVGIVQAPNGSLYITQDFYSPLAASASGPIQSLNLSAARVLALAASSSRFLGVAVVARDVSSRVETAATSSTAARKEASLAFEGALNPLIFRTNWSEAARISSGVAGGSKL